MKKHMKNMNLRLYMKNRRERMQEKRFIIMKERELTN